MIENTAERILDKCHLNSASRHMFGSIDGVLFSADDSMPQKPTPIDILIHRKKPEFRAREKQIAINLLGLEGGRPYVQHRLSRYAGESEIDWIGGKRADGSCSTGRLQQTHSFPYLGRINEKVNQYIFSEYPERAGADEEILMDITRDGQGVNDFMRQVRSYLFSAQSCWIGIDAPARKEDGTEYSALEKEQLKIRPYWQLYSPLDVIDWKYDERGELLWVKTRGTEYNDADPASVPSVAKVVKLWERGKVTVIRIEKPKDRRYKEKVTTEEIELTLKDRVPFVQCGTLTGKPIAFDDLESINRTIMDLQSVDRANLFKGVYPQLVLPAEVIERAVQDGYVASPTEAVKLLVGFNYPILVPNETNVTPQYITPSASDLSIIGERVKDLKRDMFEVVGLALEQESRQVASAEAKAWDFLDVSAVMRSAAEQLEEIEKKCVALMVAWDDSVSAWEPKYNRDFDIGDFKEEIAAIVMAANVPMPEEMTKYYLRKLFERSERLGSKSTEEERDAVIGAIDNYSGMTIDLDLAEPPPEVG